VARDFPARTSQKIPNTGGARQLGGRDNARSAAPLRARQPTASFGMESIMDELAGQVNIGSRQLRLKKTTPLRFAKRSINSARKRFVGNKSTKKKRAVGTAPIKTGVVLRRRILGRRGKGTHGRRAQNPVGRPSLSFCLRRSGPVVGRLVWGAW